METRPESHVPGETYAPDIKVEKRLDMYLESWDMLEASAQGPRNRYTLAGCLPPGSGGLDARMNLYQESLDMLEEMVAESQHQNFQAMGVFVHGILLRELGKLERYRESAGLVA